jgi:hypothetical protein
MKKLTSARLFVAPKIAHKRKARLEHAKLVIRDSSLTVGLVLIFFASS